MEEVAGEMVGLALSDISSDWDSSSSSSGPEDSPIAQTRPSRVFQSRIPRSKMLTERRAVSTVELPNLRPESCRVRSISTSATQQPTFSRHSSASPVKRVPMNRIVVGTAPSPNLWNTQSRIGSLVNANHRPGGGQVHIASQRLDWKVNPVGPRTKAFNPSYVPGGGDKPIERRKLSWTSKAKIGSLEKANHRPGGGQVKIENQKLDWNVTAKVGSTVNMRHQAGGGDVKIRDEKLDWDVGSRIRSLENVKHKAGGGDKKIFDDKEYLRSSSGLSGPNSLSSSTWDALGSGIEAITSPFLSLDASQSKPPPPASYSAQIGRKLGVADVIAKYK